MKIVGEPLGSWILPALPGGAVDGVHRHVEDYVLVVKVIYDNLQQTKVVTLGLFSLGIPNSPYPILELVPYS